MMMGMMKMSTKSHRNYPLWILVVFLVGITIVSSATTPLKKRSLVLVGRNGDSEEPLPDQPNQNKLRLPNKRTFCNAFTGCGKKRSDGSMPIRPKDYDYEEPSQDAAIVDDIARDILAEARLWEALQARNSIRSPFRKTPGFFPRQKREVHEDKGEKSK